MTDQQANKLDIPKPLLVSFNFITILIVVRVTLGVPCQKLINTGLLQENRWYMLTVREITAVGSLGTFGRSMVVISSTLNKSAFDNTAVAEEKKLTLSPKNLCSSIGVFGIVRPRSGSGCDLHSKKREYGSIRDGYELHG